MDNNISDIKYGYIWFNNSKWIWMCVMYFWSFDIFDNNVYWNKFFFDLIFMFSGLNKWLRLVVM